MNIDENSRLGAVLFYSYWTKRQNQGKSTDNFKFFAGIEYYRYDLMRIVNVSKYQGEILNSLP